MKRLFSSLKSIYQFFGGCHFVYITIICSLLSLGVYLEINRLKADIEHQKEKQVILNNQQILLGDLRLHENILENHRRALDKATSYISRQDTTIKQLIQEIEKLQRTDISRWI